MASVADRAQRRLGRLERAALRGVIVREIVNFSSFWRSSTFSSTVDPTIYLLAFGFGFGSLVSTVGGLRLHRLRRHRDRRDDRAVLGRLPGHVLDVRQVRVPAHLRRDPRRARSTPRSSSPARRCGSRRATGVYGCVPMLVGDDLRARTRAGGCCSCRRSRPSPASAGPASGSSSPPGPKTIESFSYWQSGLLDADVPGRRHLLPAQRLPQWAQVLGNLNPLYHCVQLVRDVGLRRLELGRPRPPRVPGRLRARRLAPGDPLHGAPADPLAAGR